MLWDQLELAVTAISKVPIANPCEKPFYFHTCQSLVNPCKSLFVNPCKSLKLENHELLKLAKYCKTT